LLSVKKNKDNINSVGLHRKRELWMLLLACYVLSFGTFQDLGGLRGAERMASETLTFDFISAIKVATRIIAFMLVTAGLLRARKSPKWPLVRWHLFPLALFGFWGIASTLWSSNPLYSFGHAFEFLLLVMIATLAAIVCDNSLRYSLALCHLCMIHFLYILVLIALSIAAPSSASILRPDIGNETILFVVPFDTTFILGSAEIAGIASLGLLLFRPSQE
jgi:hypothetical protein